MSASRLSFEKLESHSRRSITGCHGLKSNHFKDALEDIQTRATPKLNPDQRATVEAWIEYPSKSGDSEASTWSANLFQEQIKAECRVQYSEAHAHRVVLK